MLPSRVLRYGERTMNLSWLRWLPSVVLLVPWLLAFALFCAVGELGVRAGSRREEA